MIWVVQFKVQWVEEEDIIEVDQLLIVIHHQMELRIMPPQFKLLQQNLKLCSVEKPTKDVNALIHTIKVVKVGNVITPITTIAHINVPAIANINVNAKDLAIVNTNV